MTAGYSIFDGLGARVAQDATVFVCWAFFLDGVVFGIWAVFHRGVTVIRQDRRALVNGGFAGGASFVAYWIVVTAMTKAPIALVTALRETSVLFAVLIGVLVFRERADRGKIAAVGLIVAGVILTRL